MLHPEAFMPRHFYITFATHAEHWSGHLTIGQHFYWWTSADVGDAHLLDTEECATLEEAIVALKAEMATAATLPRPITVTRTVSIAKSGSAPTSMIIGVIASSSWFLRPTSKARGMTTTSARETPAATFTKLWPTPVK